MYTVPCRQQVTNAQVDAVCLGNKHTRNSFVECSAVHVDGGAQRQHKLADARVHLIVLF